MKFFRTVLLSVSVFVSVSASAQFKMLWEKQVQESSYEQDPDNITGVSDLDGGKFIMFQLWQDEYRFPAFAFLDKNDKLVTAQYLQIDSLENVEMVGVSRRNDTEIKIMCNDYTDRFDGKPVPVPFEIILGKTVNDSKFTLTTCRLTNVTNLAGDKEFMVTDNSSDGGTRQFLSVMKRDVNDKKLIFLYSMALGKDAKKVQFDGCDYASTWFANDKRTVVSVETPYGSNQHYYQIHVLDNNLDYVKSYPAKDKATVTSVMVPGVSDRLVRVSYKPVQDLGFASRQVRLADGRNRIGWFVFNGLPNANPVFTQVGIEGDVQPTDGPFIPENEMLITDGTLYTGRTQVDNMLVSVAFNKTGMQNDLVLSVGDYYGLETSRQVIKGYVDSSLVVVKAWANDQNQLYVLVNTPKSLSDGKQGLYLSKWEATPEAINNTLLGLQTSRGWSDTPFFAKETVKADNTAYKIVAIDESDPNYADRANLVGQELKIQDSGLQPWVSSYWFSGSVKVGKKKIDFKKVAIAKLVK